MFFAHSENARGEKPELKKHLVAGEEQEILSGIST